jgi:hypothetical protein
MGRFLLDVLPKGFAGILHYGLLARANIAPSYNTAGPSLGVPGQAESARGPGVAGGATAVDGAGAPAVPALRGPFDAPRVDSRGGAGGGRGTARTGTRPQSSRAAGQLFVKSGPPGVGPMRSGTGRTVARPRPRCAGGKTGPATQANGLAPAGGNQRLLIWLIREAVEPIAFQRRRLSIRGPREPVWSESETGCCGPTVSIRQSVEHTIVGSAPPRHPPEPLDRIQERGVAAAASMPGAVAQQDAFRRLVRAPGGRAQ